LEHQSSRAPLLTTLGNAFPSRQVAHVKLSITFTLARRATLRIAQVKCERRARDTQAWVRLSLEIKPHRGDSIKRAAPVGALSQNALTQACVSRALRSHLTWAIERAALRANVNKIDFEKSIIFSNFE